MSANIGDLFDLRTIITSVVLAIAAFLFRRVRRFFAAVSYTQKSLAFAQDDISTIWLHLGLKREQRSGSYKYPRGISRGKAAGESSDN